MPNFDISLSSSMMVILKIISLFALLWSAYGKLLLVLTRSQLFWHSQKCNHLTLFCWLYFNTIITCISFQYWIYRKDHLSRFGMNNLWAMISIYAAEVVNRRNHWKHKGKPTHLYSTPMETLEHIILLALFCNFLLLETC